MGGVVLRPLLVRSSGYVGRVGALAVALGVGAVVVGLPGVAFADTSGSAGAAGASSSSTGSRGVGSRGAGSHDVGSNGVGSGGLGGSRPGGGVR